MINLKYLFVFFMMLTTLNESVVQAQSVQKFDWQQLPAIPNKIGFAGSFAGVAGDALIVAGGANFPDGGAPWSGSKKAWTDEIFVLEKPDGSWKSLSKLPKKMGYGVSVNYKNTLIIIGGSNQEGHHQDVFQLHYENGQIRFDHLPNLPEPIANTCGVLAGNVIYVMGGIKTPDAKIAGNNFWALDLAADKKVWKLLPSWPGEPRMLSVAGSIANAIYLFSGVTLINGERKYLNDAYRYTANKGWEKLADLPSSVAAAPTPAFSNKKQLLIFGGDNGELASKAAELKGKHPGFSTEVLSYNPKTNSWNKIGEIKTDIKEDAAKNPNGSLWASVTTTLTVWHGKVIVPGGEVRPATRTPNVLVAMPQ